jgi:Golgi apparatus protein 1
MNINLKCQHVIWEHTLELIKDDNVQESSQRACGTDLSILGCSTTGKIGVLLSCMIDNREKIKNGLCQTFIQRLEWAAFSDFRIITHFTTDCENDIKNTECGRLQAEKVCG